MFSDPVVGNRFFGRSQALSLLSKRVDGLKDGYRQNIAIVGPKLIGKSSLILHFLSNFNHSQIVPVYIDLRPNSFYQFVYKFQAGLLYHYLKNKGLDVGEELDALKRCAQDYIPQTVKSIAEVEGCIKNLQFNQAYEKLLCLTTTLKQESGISCMIILDDFHLLGTYKIKDPFLSMAREIMTQKDIMYILISSQISYAKRILANELSLLFGNFEVVALEPFDYPTCCKFLEKRFQDINLSRTFRDFLIAESRGYPFYLDILSNKLKEKAKELDRVEITPGLISQAFNSLIYDSQGILNQYFTSMLQSNLNGADYANFLPILSSASARGCRLGEISKATNRRPQIVLRYINYLLDKDLLSKCGIFYTIQDKIFRFWLKSVYQRKSQSLTADPVTESKDFCKEIEDQIQGFAQEVKKKLAERAVALFKSFRNEIVLLQNKCLKFWHFEEVRLCSLGDLEDCVIARYKERYWACLIKKEAIDEAQIQDFLHYCKKSKYNIRRIIIISLKELDLNVRLAALEKKIWIWGLSDLNFLMDVYGKQPVIQ